MTKKREIEILIIFLLTFPSIAFAESYSIFQEHLGKKYEVRFTSSSNIKVSQKKDLIKDPDYCLEEFEEEYIIKPSWTIEKTPPIIKTKTWEIHCFVGAVPTECQFQYYMLEGMCDGRHPTSTHPLPRPLGSIIGKSQNVPHTIPSTGLVLEYAAPDNAGDFEINYTITFPGSPFPSYAAMGIRVGLMGFEDLNAISGMNTYLTFNNITSHDYGTYAVPGLGTDLIAALQNYVWTATNILAVPNSPNQFYPLNSEGASLQFGGIFDINKNWLNSHKAHRQGTNVDVGMSLLKAHPDVLGLMDLLDSMLRNNNFIMPEDSESIRASSTDYASSNYHWHLSYPQGEVY